MAGTRGNRDVGRPGFDSAFGSFRMMHESPGLRIPRSSQQSNVPGPVLLHSWHVMLSGNVLQSTDASVPNAGLSSASVRAVPANAFDVPALSSGIALSPCNAKLPR